MPALTTADLHRQVRELERAHRRGDAGALARVAPYRPDPAKPLKVAGAQMVVAREHGFPGWAQLRSYVERVAGGGGALEFAFHEDLDYYEERAEGLLASAQDGTPGAVAAFEGAGLELTSEGARAVVAGRHGFPSWTALRRHVRGLRESGEPFARAYVALEAGDLETLRALLERFPELALAHGTNGNDLINMARDEATTRLLLEHGAAVGHANAHGWTPLHQAAYAGAVGPVRMLLEAGAPADVSGRGAGGTPLVIALFWGHRDAAEVLAAVDGGPHPGNLRVAAGLGDLDRIGALVGADGIVAEAAGALRGFYRPHSGFPAWAPAEDPQEIADEALSWAARNDRVDALSLLVERGARVDADVYRGTALAWAAATGRVAAVERLVELGAGVDAPTTFGGPDHAQGATALHLAAGNGSLDVVEALLAAGADPTRTDARHESPPAGWAEHAGHGAVAALLRSRGG
jgi:ankyrin repeat protein